MDELELHEPVLVKEVLDTLSPAPGKVIVDATLGHGGHSLAILSQLGGEGLLVGIDRDPQMLATARRRIEAAHVPESCYKLIVADHSQLPQVLAETFPNPRVSAPDGFLFDLGPSTPQLLDPRLGLSWQSDEALDMRINPRLAGPSAADIVAAWDEAELARLFRVHTDERWAGRIARRIVEARAREPIRTGRRLGEIVAGAIPRKAWPPRIHPATRVFLALRIEVNGEYRTLESALPVAFEWLRPAGRLVVISFHSGEDRRVKEFMRAAVTPAQAPWPLPQGEARATARPVTHRPLVAGEAEQARNPRSRSARLRAIEKI
ncbi:MAG: 16S rRNA (cytosine(1402)-N(4))-methyltransferase RsmH [bacterium]|nr:16S rRNA (cytosine(1402)-N(4))-methyltransferase RsmH [bacterium]